MSTIDKRAGRLAHTSADDCKIDLMYVDDLEVLRVALAECVKLGYKTKVRHIASRIRQLEGKKEYYCRTHVYNPPENSGFLFCPHCELEVEA